MCVRGVQLRYIFVIPMVRRLELVDLSKDHVNTSLVQTCSEEQETVNVDPQLSKTSENALVTY